MNRAEFDEMLLARWRRLLTPREQESLEAHFARHPGDREEWEAEGQLRAALDQLPEREPSSNFTAQVLAAVRREEPRRVASMGSGWRTRFAGWRLATAAAAAAVLLVAGLHQFETTQRGHLAQNAASLSTLTLPTLDLLQDFDAIYSMSQAAPPVTADLELLLALQ